MLTFIGMEKTYPPALLLIDIQKGLDHPTYYGRERNNPEAELNAGRLLAFWRKQQWPVYHVQHASTNPASPLAEGKPGHALKDEVLPMQGEPVIKKHENSAFIGTDLKQRLDDANIRQLVVAGLTTEHCVSTTVRMAGNLGFQTYLVSDATAAFSKIGLDNKEYSAEEVHQVSLATLHQEFAMVMTMEKVLELMKDF